LDSFIRNWCGLVLGIRSIIFRAPKSKLTATIYQTTIPSKELLNLSTAKVDNI
jgi:hypothetical protein